jgi:glycosyltransferase involved in cell wall biosynthesis
MNNIEPQNKKANFHFREKNYALAFLEYIKNTNGPEITKKIARSNISILIKKLNIGPQKFNENLLCLDEKSGLNQERVSLIVKFYRDIGPLNFLSINDITLDIDSDKLKINKFNHKLDFESLVNYVIRNPAKCIHFFGTSTSNLFLAFLYKLVWKSKLIIDHGNEINSNFEYFIDYFTTSQNDFIAPKFLPKTFVLANKDDFNNFISKITLNSEVNLKHDEIIDAIYNTYFFRDLSLNDSALGIVSKDESSSSSLDYQSLIARNEFTSTLRIKQIEDLKTSKVRSDFKSRIERINPAGLNGWIGSERDPNKQEFFLALDVDNKIVEYGQFNIPRHDVIKSLGFFASSFSFGISYKYFDGIRHTAKIWMIEKDEKFLIGQKDFEITSPWDTNSKNIALFCSHNLKIQGAQTSLFQLVIGLKNKLNITPIVYSPSDGPLRSKYESEGIKVIVQKEPGHKNAQKDIWLRELRNLINCFGHLKPKFVIANTLLSFHAAISSLALNLPLLLIPRESENPAEFFHFADEFIRPYANDIVLNSSATVFVSSTTMDLWKSKSLKDNFHLIHNGLLISEVEKKLAGKNKKNLKLEFNLTDEIVILSVGTVCERKGQKDLINSVPILYETLKSKFKIFIVGLTNDPYSIECKEIINGFQRHLQELIVLLPHTDSDFDSLIPELYTVSDLFVMNSRFESYPRVILEALYFGLPVISTPCFGVKEQIEEFKSGLFYEEGSSLSLSTKISYLVNDKNILLKFKENAQRRFTELTSYVQMIESYIEVLSKIGITKY